jgi:hypothetical protein
MLATRLSISSSSWSARRFAFAAATPNAVATATLAWNANGSLLFPSVLSLEIDDGS